VIRGGAGVYHLFTKAMFLVDEVTLPPCDSRILGITV
jgi:hypothetical protein